MSEKFEIDKKDARVMAVLFFVAFMLSMAGLSFSIATVSKVKHHHCLPEMLFAKMQPGVTYLVRQRPQDGVWDVQSSQSYDVRTSCQVVTAPAN